MFHLIRSFILYSVYVQGGHVTEIKKLCTETHLCGTFPSTHYDVSLFGDTTMPDVETDDDAAGVISRSGVPTFFGARGRVIRMAASNGNYELRMCHNYLISFYLAQ